MADDQARAGRVPLRRVLRGLLVLAGLLFAGWLLGGLAQSAHADELPPATKIVRPTVDHVVNEVMTPPATVVPPVEEKKAPVAAPPRAAVAPPPKAASPTVDAVRAPRPPEKRQHVVPERPVVRKYKVVRHRSATVAEVRVPAPDVRPAPIPAPVQDESTAAGAPVFAGAAGLSDVRVRIPARPRASAARPLGPVPPVVRTAADEPSFAPD
ncbi:hypothetical protein AGRA3207_004596 [Actinomadura graeca]|uniref:Uncharacterized protein n=1 Tax=Actinomadura graeca TaxID=2750812 RepID=A0ABX8QXB6_9ACTN|nr:hypothetical protein [Actinomadura graeca]QXJ23446.1 hypothetical protein AGRA3207_004596 [Actinomadura graeca]